MNTPASGYEITEEPEHPMRCLVRKKEFSAHVAAIKRLVAAIKSDDHGNRDELVRCADAAADKIAETLGLSNCVRGITAKK
ncbi:unnamed protein product [marine sediment metagenome]|uniref:Uncharacterized protein n=1 Tax=marine sediment metagenome TaxID=412755 RepID=X0SZG4_9ZZZZ